MYCMEYVHYKCIRIHKTYNVHVFIMLQILIINYNLRHGNYVHVYYIYTPGERERERGGERERGE